MGPISAIGSPAVVPSTNLGEHGPMEPIARRSGFGMVEMMVASAMLALLMVGFMTFSKMQSKTTRQIASQGGATDLSNGLDVLFGNPRCATTGGFEAGGAPVSVVASGASYTLAADTLRYAAGQVALTTQPDPTIQALIQPSTIDAIQFDALGGAGPNGATGFLYPFRLTARFKNVQGPPPLPLVKYVIAYTDPANKVVGMCFVGNASNTKHATGRVVHGDVISPPPGYNRSDCSLVVTPEDMHVDPDYSGNFGDTNLWGDNHYAGPQAFYDANWQVTCRYGFLEFDNMVPPNWHNDGKCRYVMICTK